MANVSAGMLMYRRTARGLEVLLAHPGGPYFVKKDAGGWTIPKGEPEPGEAIEAAAEREFTEETGLPVSGQRFSLGEIRQKGGKTVRAWAFAGDIPPGFAAKSNLFEMEWPPRSGKRASFPEIDRAEMFPLEVARVKINPAQAEFLDRLVTQLG
jgi:predicted NUDIX family NTP pyrophosphohydrolase